MTARCGNGGRPVARARIRRAIYVAGRGWLIPCRCGAVPGTEHRAGHVVLRPHDREVTA